MNVDGRLAVITGGSSGIGAATAQALARRGARVALLARTQADLENVADDIRRAGGQACAYPVDLGDAEAAEQTARGITAEMGLPDILINSAGAGRWLFAEETTPAEARQMMAAPYFAAFFITRAFLPEMLKRNSGVIVTINSPAARIPWPGATAYVAARWALYGFTEALRADLSGTGLRVTSVVLGKVNSPYFIHNAGVEERIPGLGRIIPVLSPEQAAAVVVRAIERNQREAWSPLLLRLFAVTHHFFPWLMEALVNRTGWRRRD
jgi:short-subunit dehydrogenase